MSSGQPSWNQWDWTPWVWTSEHRCYERHRWADEFPHNGQWVYEYTPDPSPSSQIPRQPNPDDFATGLSQMDLNQPHYPAMDTRLSVPQHRFPSTGIHNPSPANENRIKTKNSNVKYDEIDNRFRTYKSKEFLFGRIFKVAWSEPNGSGGTEITAATYGLQSHNTPNKIRRFVVISNRRGHSICLPIVTYGGQGTLKHGAHPEDHAVIYSIKKPYYLPGEKDLIQKRSIKCTMVSPEHKLDPASRLNYAKLYTIEHNVKVWFIGNVDEDQEQRVVTDYNATHPQLADRHVTDTEPFYTMDTSPPEGRHSNWNHADPSHGSWRRPEDDGGGLSGFGMTVPGDSLQPIPGHVGFPEEEEKRVKEFGA